MEFEELIKAGNYNKALDYAAAQFDNLNKKEMKLLERMLLFCGIDFLSTFKNGDYENNMNNPFFLKNNRLSTIKIILDSNVKLFYYLYININNEEYIEKELKKYWEYFSDIVFIKKDTFYCEKKLKNNLQKDGIIQVKNIFKPEEIEKIKKITLEYMSKTELSAYLPNENRHRVYLTEKNNSDVLSIFHNLVDTKKIEKLLKKHINIDVNCDFIQLERMEKTPVQSHKIKHWHLDNLADQFKVFIPLVEVTENNAPMNYIPGTHVIKNLNNEMKNYIHYIFRMSGIVTTPTTGLPNYIVNNINDTQQKGTIKTGDIAIFNSGIIHSGSFVKDDSYRLNLVLVFNNVLTNRNILLKQLKPFY